jgi:hypothetical protein
MAISTKLFLVEINNIPIPTNRAAEKHFDNLTTPLDPSSVLSTQNSALSFRAPSIQHFK